MTLAAGTRLGAYEITGPLGAGGMGEVYRARDTKLGRDVAIKTLPATLASDRDRLARFEREAKLLAALNHAHIAAIYGLDEHEGTLYIAMELVEGETLEERLKRGPLPVEQALELALQIAEALEAAHEKGVVHRDLKPANVMVTNDGVVKVLDFGLGKAFSGDPNRAAPAHSPALSLAMTQQGLILGTAAYMSPEQASGQATDQRADVWAFGVVLYEMLTGMPAFGGESMPHILAAVLQTEPDWNRLAKNLHPRIKLCLERCLEKRARNRYHDISDARVDIEKALKDPQSAKMSPSDVRPAWQRVLPFFATAAVAAAVAILVALNFRARPEPAPINRLVYPVSLSGGRGFVFRGSGRAILALSPDGRRFVYNHSDGLYVRPMDSLEAQLVTDEDLTNPFFSPDGRSVAYYSRGRLKRIGLSGGSPVVIAEGVMDPFGASWGSDGTILFGQPAGIFRVSAAGGTPTLVVPAEPTEQLYGPELLTDGDSVLFSSKTTDSWDEAQIVIQSLSTGRRTVLVTGGSDARYVPTGHLVYARGDGLLAVPFDLASRSVTGGAVSVVKGVTRAFGSQAAAAANYAIAKDGTLIYVSYNPTTATDVTTLVWLDRNGKEEPLGIGECICGHPKVSPDGTRVAATFAGSVPGDLDIWVWSLAQRARTRVSFEDGLQAGPVWSPDSARIAYSTLGDGLFVRRADGTGTAQLLIRTGTNPVVDDWYADDELIFSEKSGGPTGYDINVLRLSGKGERHALLATGFDERRAALSPDKRWLAYQSDESGQYEVYVRPFPDVDAGKWLVSSGGGEEPKWSPDGRTLFFVGPRSFMEAAVVGSGAGFAYEPPRAVVDRGAYVSDSVAPRQYDLSPEGQRFLVVKPLGGTGPPPQIVVVTNFVEELKRVVPIQ